MMCTGLAFSCWGGKRFAVDLSNLRHKRKAGVRSERACTARIDDRYFALIETYGGKGHLLRLPKSVRIRVRKNYELWRARRKHRAFLVPIG